MIIDRGPGQVSPILDLAFLGRVKNFIEVEVIGLVDQGDRKMGIETVIPHRLLCDHVQVNVECRRPFLRIHYFLFLFSMMIDGDSAGSSHFKILIKSFSAKATQPAVGRSGPRQMCMMIALPLPGTIGLVLYL